MSDYKNENNILVCNSLIENAVQKDSNKLPINLLEQRYHYTNHLKKIEANKNEFIKEQIGVISPILNLLDKIGADINEHYELFSELVKYSQEIENISIGFNALLVVGANLNEHLEIFFKIVECCYNNDKVSLGFSALIKIGANINEHSKLFLQIIQYSYNHEKISLGFAALIKIGANPNEHSDLFLQIIKYSYNHEKIALGFVALIKIGASLNEHFELFLQMIEHHYYNEEIFFAFDVLLNNGANIDDHLNIFLEVIEYTHKIENISFGFNLTKNSYFYSLAIKNIINNKLSEENELTQGPLNKTNETINLENILEKISVTNLDKIDLRFDNSCGYLLQFENEEEIYLNELLKFVNFNHLTLTDEQIERLGNQMQSLQNEAFDPFNEHDNIIVNSLPEAARHSIYYYGSIKYKNINLLFRGMEQFADEYGHYIWISPVNGKKNLLINFICGCLVNWAANELCLKFEDNKQRRILGKIFTKDEVSKILTNSEYQSIIKNHLYAKNINQDEYNCIIDSFSNLDIFFPKHGLLDRGEQLDEYTKQARLANPVYVSGVMSASVFASGSPFFHNNDTTRTKIEANNFCRTVITQQEGEVLIPHGSTFLYTENLNGTFFAREINSPGVIPSGGYWSSIALTEAYKLYLSKPYGSNLIIDGKVISRPNHGLAHTHRVMTYIDIIINYFAHHALNEDFKSFCQNICHNEREWLRVTSAFSVTGRESEVSPVFNLTIYDKYRENSKNHLVAFLKKYPPNKAISAFKESNFSVKTSERMQHILRWMGNPSYEVGYQEKPPINQHEDLNERMHRNFLYRILTSAHKLDLIRCYKPNEFDHSMKYLRELSVKNDVQLFDYINMVQYAFDLNHAHGNMLYTKITSSGKLEGHYSPYQTPFAMVSTNLQQLQRISKTIKQPKLTEQYQFRNTI